MDGLCDVKECSKATCLGWRPLTERRGRQICEYHWLRHKDETDSFDLFEVFKFRRSERMRKSVVKKYVYRCSCGRELLPGRRFCTVCAVKRERQRKKRAYHERKKPQAQPLEDENMLCCRRCGNECKTGHTYCSECAKRQSKQSNRERQRRYYRKRIAG